MINRISKSLLIGIIMGLLYMGIEGIYHIPKGGYANIIMAPIGGLCGLLVGSINQFDKFYNMAIWKQSLIGAIIVLIIEAISGYIINIKLGLHIWDYSELAFNWKGQICLSFGVIWYAMMPLVIWFDDLIRNILWKEKPKYSLKDTYIKWITFK